MGHPFLLDKPVIAQNTEAIPESSIVVQSMATGKSQA